MRQAINAILLFLTILSSPSYAQNAQDSKLEDDAQSKCSVAASRLAAGVPGVEVERKAQGANIYYHLSLSS
jgi:hypothetical protein